jgi:hypothetical protein
MENNENYWKITEKKGKIIMKNRKNEKVLTNNETQIKRRNQIMKNKEE